MDNNTASALSANPLASPISAALAKTQTQNPVARPHGIKHDQSSDKTRAAAQDFAAVFYGQMTEKMLSSPDTESFWGNDKGVDFFRGQLANEYGKSMAQNSPLTDQIQTQLIKLQEIAQ